MIKKKLKSLKKSHIIIAAIDLVLLILIGLCLWRCNVYVDTLLCQKASETFRGQSEERFAQVSCFIPTNSAFSETDVLSFRQTIDKKLSDGGVEMPEQGSNWMDAYSALGTLNVEGEKNSASATVIAVGGNFFNFHPLYLMSGSYIQENDLMGDRVVLDYDLAWNLFGSSELEGMTVKINGLPYYVAGVVKRETDRFSDTAFSGEPVIFMSYSAYEKINPEVSLNCYEVVMRDPVSNFVENTVKDAFAEVAVVENSERYSFSSIFSLFKKFGERSMQTDSIIYPYWENAARLSEAYIARLWVVIAVLALLPFITVVWLLIKLIRFIIQMLKKGGKEAREAWDDRYGRLEKFRNCREEKRRKKARKVAAEDKEPKKHIRKKKLLKSRKKSSLKTQDDQDITEKELSMDVESIVREVMDKE